MLTEEKLRLRVFLSGGVGIHIFTFLGSLAVKATGGAGLAKVQTATLAVASRV